MTLHAWAQSIAREVAPEEQELAPIYLDAYLEGGPARDELFARQGAVLGGFGVESSAPTFVVVLQSMAITAPVMLAAFGSPAMNTFLGIVRNGLAVAELAMGRKSKMVSDAETAAASEQRTTSGDPVRQPEVAQEIRSMILQQPEHRWMAETIDTMTQELQRAGESEERSYYLTLRVVRRMLEQPRESQEALRALAAK